MPVCPKTLLLATNHCSPQERMGCLLRTGLYSTRSNKQWTLSLNVINSHSWRIEMAATDPTTSSTMMIIKCLRPIKKILTDKRTHIAAPFKSRRRFTTGRLYNQWTTMERARTVSICPKWTMITYDVKFKGTIITRAKVITPLKWTQAKDIDLTTKLTLCPLT